jgi:hypothetical protein
MRQDGPTMTIPRTAHFVFALTEQEEPFHLLHYLALESCRRVLLPDEIVLHHKHLPYGVYWDLIRPHLTLVEVDLVTEVLDGPSNETLVPARFRYAHHADFIRLDALISRGGVYADMDTLFVRPFPPGLYEQAFVIGEEYAVRDELTGETKASLCNAVLMAEPDAAFAVAWREEMGSALNGTWSNHSGFLADELRRRHPGTVHIEPARSFFRFPPDREGLKSLLERNDTDTAGVLSIHLWGHLWWDAGRQDFSDVHAARFTDHYIRTVDTTYNCLARRFLPDLDLW